MECVRACVCAFNGGKSDAPRAQLRPSGSRFPCFHSNHCPITAAALFSVRWSHFSAVCVHARVYARQCSCASIRDCVFHGCLSSLHPNNCAENFFFSSTSPHQRRKPSPSLSFCSGAWKRKKIPHWCSGLQPLTIPLLLLLHLFSHLSLPPPLSKPLIPPHTLTYHVIYLLHHHWCLWSWRVSNQGISPEINISEAVQPGWCS